MKLADDTVIAASNSWIWIPDAATATETDEYLIVRFPDYFDHPLEVIRFTPAGPVADAVEMVLDRSREYGLARLWWMVRLDSPPGVAELLAARARPWTSPWMCMTDHGVARLWFAAVVESARGQGLYRAILAARLTYAARHGARMALVKGRVETSGPILRRAGFAAYGQELIYAVPLGYLRGAGGLAVPPSRWSAVTSPVS